MGTLDDAIREHLDLKRQRGADPAEVARQERDALGPLRREDAPDAPFASPDPDDLEEVEQPTRVLRPDDAPGPPSDRRAGPDQPTELIPPDEVPGGRTPGLALPSEAGAQGEPLEDDVPEEGPASTPTPTPRPAPYDLALDDGEELADERAGDEEDDDGESDESEESEADDDVLEETPDSLQEAPEHDRLWFEQRPPRDFDFDD